MRGIFEKFILGGKYEVPGADPLYTQIFPTRHFILTGQSGDFAAFFAAAVVRREEVAKAEEIAGVYKFEDNLLIGDTQLSVAYESPLSVLDWWASSLEKIVDLELSLAVGEHVAVRLDRDCALQGFASLDWFVERANCRPKGLIYKEGAEEEPEDFDDEDADSDLIQDDNMKNALHSLEEAQKGPEGFLDAMGIENRADDGTFDGSDAKATAMHIVGEDGEIYSDLPSIAPAPNPDGFRPEHIKLLEALKEQLAVVAAEVPQVGHRWLTSSSGKMLSRKDLGESLYGLNYSSLQSTFPDLFAAERAMEDFRAAKAKKEKEKREGKK
jgi:hypothetical protein